MSYAVAMALAVIADVLAVRPTFRTWHRVLAPPQSKRNEQC